MKRLIYLLLLFVVVKVSAQNNIDFQKPPKDILDLVDVERAPSVYIDDKKENMILLYTSSFKTIADLSRDEMRLGGLRIDPKTNIGSRTNYLNNIKIRKLNTKNSEAIQVEGLPANPRLTNLRFSPDQSMLAMTNTTEKGVEIWVLDLETVSARKITEAKVNANLKDVINWFKDSKAMLVKFIPEEKEALIDAKSSIPTGPTISQNDGKKAQNRTYQDLLKNKTDERNFEQLALSVIYKVNLDGTKTQWLPKDMYKNISFSPDGKYVMVSKVEKPFSYLVPYYRFPSKTTVYTKEAKLVENVLTVPLIEDLPQGFMSVRKGRRGVQWRTDMPASLIYVEALDEGDPAKEVDFRDEVFQLEAPFKGEGKSILKMINRFYKIEWGNKELAVAHDYWWNSRNTKSYIFNPSNSAVKPEILYDRNYQDLYSDPGEFVTRRNEFGRYTLAMEGSSTFLIGDGYSKEGQFPFLDKLNLKTKKTNRLYQSAYKDKIEELNDYDPKAKELRVRIESKTEYPNYYFRNIKKNKLDQLTYFENPFKSVEGVHKELIKYKREDGVELSGTLYLPVGYDKEKKEKVPMILWAYPTEYKDKSSAGQTTSNPNEFTYLYWASPVFWVTKGYAVLDDAAFPIVGEGDEEPNDSFRKQLVANAKAAIDAVDEMGYIDRNRVACGGHSYGAFMVANLLSHSDLFAAGIARSGAYNRTLTPFGFQSEERNYWEAPEIYYNMSPFMHADKMKHALLLVHGEADNNSGTYPMQSERYFNALKGLGATVRLVMLPKESHGYRAKENILHLLWEQDQWLEKHVKNHKVKPAMAEKE
jgi:dipeptidyl aminopeptidase/acylaminoacyl peptidase